jgi:hypothetical protein
LKDKVSQWYDAKKATYAVNINSDKVRDQLSGQVFRTGNFQNLEFKEPNAKGVSNIDNFTKVLNNKLVELGGNKLSDLDARKYIAENFNITGIVPKADATGKSNLYFKVTDKNGTGEYNVSVPSSEMNKSLRSFAELQDQVLRPGQAGKKVTTYYLSPNGETKAIDLTIKFNDGKPEVYAFNSKGKVEKVNTTMSQLFEKSLDVYEHLNYDDNTGGQAEAESKAESLERDKTKK